MLDGSYGGPADARAMEAKRYDAARVPHALTGAGVGVDYASNGLGSTSAVEKTSTPVRDTVCGLENLLSDLHGVINALEERFDTILTPSPPLPGRPDDPRAVPTMRAQSHLQTRLAILAEGYQAAIVRPHQLGLRIEL